MTIAQLPFPQLTGFKHQQEYVLPAPLTLRYNGSRAYQVPPGVKIRLIRSQNYHIAILPPAYASPNGDRIFQH